VQNDAARLKAIEGKYGEQVCVVFYDVWTKEHEAYGRQYAIRLIPTQVFLDENGNEFFRYEGFFPRKRLIGCSRIED
jgi:thioredoxin 1